MILDGNWFPLILQVSVSLLETKYIIMPSRNHAHHKGIAPLLEAAMQERDSSYLVLLGRLCGRGAACTGGLCT